MAAAAENNLDCFSITIINRAMCNALWVVHSPPRSAYHLLFDPKRLKSSRIPISVNPASGLACHLRSL
jgi:hypothetical protein